MVHHYGTIMVHHYESFTSVNVVIFWAISEQQFESHLLIGEYFGQLLYISSLASVNWQIFWAIMFNILGNCGTTV